MVDAVTFPARPPAPPSTPRARPALAAPGVKPIVRWTLALLVFSIPFEMPGRAFPVEIPTLTAGIFLVATLFQLGTCYARRPPALLWFALYLYAFAVSAVWNASGAVATDLNDASYWGEVTHLFVLLLQVVLVFWAASNVLRVRAVARTALMTLGVACTVRALLPVLGIARTAHVQWGGGERISALGQNANSASMILAAGLVALVGLHYGTERPPVRPRWLIWPLVALVGLSAVNTGSRGGLLALGAGLVVFMFQRTRSVWVSVRNALVVALAGALVIFATYQSDLMRRRFEESMEGGSLAGRERIYPGLLAMVKERPVLGFGPVNNKYELGIRLDERRFRRRDAHNLVLEVLSSTGLAGAIPFLVAVGLCATGAWRARRGGHGTLPLAMVAVVLTANMSGNWIVSKLLWLVLAYAVASQGYRPGIGRAPPQAASN